MVFTWHEPQSLIAEATLASLALVIFLYRLCGGSNEWLRTHGVILSCYYAIGGVVYDELEGWKLLDTTYFLTVTVTTVGYGDMCPETDEGKIFTVVYALLGLIFVFAALSPLLDMLIFVKDLILKPFTPPDPLETECAGTQLNSRRARRDTPFLPSVSLPCIWTLAHAPIMCRSTDGELDLDDLRARGNWGFKYISALMGPLIVFIVGIGLGYVLLDLSTVDGIYWSMITMTTIGYGDISGSSNIEKAVLCIYLPVAVAALADTLSAIGTIGTARSIIYDEPQADELLMGEQAGNGNVNFDETLTEAEFIISVLKEKGIVDDLTIQAVRLQFAHLTRHDKATKEAENKVVDTKIVFLELRSKGRIAQNSPGAPTKTPEGKAIDLVDLKGPQGGFTEWKTKYWQPRLLSYNGGGGARLESKANITTSKVDIDGYTRLDAGTEKTPTTPAKAAGGKPSSKRGSPSGKSPSSGRA